jgi:hypothetical protein
MPISTSCPDCGAAYELPDDFGGKRVRCRQCQQPFSVPAPVKVIDESPAEAGDPDAAEGDIQTQPRRAPSPPPVPAGREADESRPRRRPRYDDEEDDRPRRRPPPRRRDQGSRVGLVVAAAVGLLVLLGCGCGGLALYLMPADTFDRDDGPPDVAVAAPEEKAAIENPQDGWRNPQPPAFPPDFQAVLPFVENQDDGHALAPTAITPPAAPAIRPPALDGDRVEVKLSAPATAVAVGGAGRYLILYLPTEHHLALFDANEGRIVRTLPADDNARFAAGMDKLLVVQPATRLVERWSLTTFRMEASATIKMEVPPVAVAMGSASNGPLLISGVDWPRLGETAFFDPIAMRRIDMSFHPHGFFETSPNIFLRASADGRTFASQANGFGGGTQACVWSNGRLRKYGGNGGTNPVPAEDGHALYSADGLYSVDLRRLAGAGTRCLPAEHGPYYLTVASPRPLPRRGAATTTLSVCLEGDERPFATVTDEGLPADDGPVRDPLPADRRVHLIPDAKLLVTIPPGNDRLILRRFDPEQELEKSGFDYVIVTSRAPTAAKRGGEYAYQLAVKSKKGGVSYRLLSGPPGAAVDAGGKVTWRVPANFAGPTADFAVEISDHAGRDNRHAFRIDVVD